MFQYERKDNRLFYITLNHPRLYPHSAIRVEPDTRRMDSTACQA
jgi:hypothetical protein